MPTTEKTAETYAIQGIDIFAVGEWNGDKYSDKDLDQIVQSFDETRDYLKPYVKLGHGEEQSLLRSDELPAAGYIDKIYRKGQKIVADLVRVPKKIYELIKRQAYTKISSELFVNLKVKGKKYPLALKSIALLGGETPAVHTLDEIHGLFSLDAAVLAFSKEADTVAECQFDIRHFNENDRKEEQDMATIEELTRQNAKLEAEIKSVESENAALENDFSEAQAKLKTMETSLKEFKDKSENLEKSIAKMEKDVRDKEIETEVRSYVKEGKIVPAQEPLLVALLKNVRPNEETKVFSANGKDFSDIKSLVKAFVDSYTDEIKVENEPKSDDAKANYSDDAFVKKVEAFAQEKKISFKEAYLTLAPSNQTEDKE